MVEYTSLYLHWVPVSYGALGTLLVINAAMNAMARPMVAMALIGLRTVVLYVPLAWFLQKTHGFFGIVLALSVVNLIIGAVAVYWQRRTMP